MRGVPRRRRHLIGRLGADRDADFGGAADDDGERFDVIEVETVHDAEARSGDVRRPARVVAPTSVKRGTSTFSVRAEGPCPITTSTEKSSIAE